METALLDIVVFQEHANSALAVQQLVLLWDMAVELGAMELAMEIYSAETVQADIAAMLQEDVFLLVLLQHVLLLDTIAEAVMLMEHVVEL